jgi:hypothetical protein
MGSILEGVLLARAQLSAWTAYKSGSAPRDKAGKSPAIQNWNLSTLIDVTVDVGWLKTGRGNSATSYVIRAIWRIHGRN